MSKNSFPFQFFLCVFISMFVPGVSFAQQQLQVVKAYAFDTTLGMANGSAYLELKNVTESNVEIIDIESNVSKFTQIHTHVQDGDVRRMTAMELPILIRPDEHLIMSPGGIHIMLLGLESPLNIGDEIEVILSVRGGDDESFPINIEVFDIGMRSELEGDPKLGSNH